MPSGLKYFPTQIRNAHYLSQADASNTRLIESLLLNNFPVIFQMGMSGGYTGPGGGVWTPALNPPLGNHVVLLYGYNRVTQIFEAKNSAYYGLPF